MNEQYRKWTEADESKLVECSNRGFSKKRMALELNRTEASIKKHLRIRGLSCRLKHRHWEDSEVEQFKEDWTSTSLTMYSLRKKYKNRSYGALKQEANRLGLGIRYTDDGRLTASDIEYFMHVNRTKLAYWLDHGLKAEFIKTNYSYLIDQDDLLNFLEVHQDWFNGKYVNEDFFYHTPDWLREKIRHDKITKEHKSKECKYSESDIRTLISMFNSGKSDKEIAIILNRTPVAISIKRQKLKLKRR